jgi:AraC family transcriptional regulator
MGASKLPRGRFFGRELVRREVGDLVLVESHHAAGTRLPRHWHEHAYFCLNFGGSYSESYGRRRRDCRMGMLVFHPPGECHAEDHHSVVASLNVELSGAWLGRISELVAPLDQPAEFGGDDIAAAGLEILRELRRGDRDSALAIEGLTLEILAASARRKRTVDARAPRWLRDACDLLNARVDPVSLRAVAAQAGVHPVHFAATFRRFLGCSVGEYQRGRRFEYARQKLADRGLTLAQVAVDAGFADQSHLTRTFKRFSGMTPSEYRTFLGFKTGHVTR